MSQSQNGQVLSKEILISASRALADHPHKRIYGYICTYMRIYANICAYICIEHSKNKTVSLQWERMVNWSRRENAKKKNSLLLHRSQHSPPPPATVNADEKYQTFLTLNLRSFEWEIFLAESLELFFAN